MLVVEDNDDLLDFISSELEDSFLVLTAGNGVEALEQLNQGTVPELVISDIMMPEMDGIRLFKEIRKLGYSDIPFLFLTARTSPEEKLEALGEGAMDYLYKPFSTRELHLKIKNIVKQNKELRRTLKDRLMKRVIKVFEDEPDDTPAKSDQSASDTILRKFAEAFQLSGREKQIMFLAFNGMQDKEIASELNIAISTVSNTLSRVYKKTDVSGRVDLLRKITYWQ